MQPLVTPAPIEEARATREAQDFAGLLAAAKQRKRPAIHSFHRWFGKLIPAIPAAAIEAFTSAGDLVIDPFCGSGTSLVEARVAQRRALGHDIHPLATLLSRVKTRAPDPKRLRAAAGRVGDRLADGQVAGSWRDRLPPLPNLAHFYTDEVARDLVVLLDAARSEPEQDLREWLLALVSAINRDVSNADTRHVFPGVSKRMRALIAEGWKADVPARFARALRDRLAASQELAFLAGDAPEAIVNCAPADALDVVGEAALVVTNPPYVSSIRYVETMKLETWWLGLVGDREGLQALDQQTLGTERVGSCAPSDEEIEALASPSARAIVAQLASGHPQMARVAATYLAGLERALVAAARALRPAGVAVIKLAPSRIRGDVLPTPLACVELLDACGVRLVGSVCDAYDPARRNLTAFRNWYSGRMDADELLVFRKDAS